MPKLLKTAFKFWGSYGKKKIDGIVFPHKYTLAFVTIVQATCILPTALNLTFKFLLKWRKAN